MKYKQFDKMNKLMQSEIRNMSIECDKIGGINLSQGICDLPLSDILLKYADEAMKAGENHYTTYNGIEFLREQIVEKAKRFNGIEANVNNIIVTAGTTGALYSACFALFDKGDEILLFEPYYGYHEYTLMALDLVPVYSPLKLLSWDIDFENLQSLVTSKTKAIIINTPCNPCGKVFSRKELEDLGDFCKKNNLFVLTDEIYEYITYDNHKHISPASLPIFKDRTITISGYSKTFSITGWRIGYSIAEESITELIGGASDLIYVCAPSPLQSAVAHAIDKTPDSFYESLKSQYQIKRDKLCRTLNKIGLTPSVPQGAYYILADVAKIPGTSSKEKAMYILNKAKIGVVPGEAFYNNGGGTDLVRFCFAKDMALIDDACERLEKLKF